MTRWFKHSSVRRRLILSFAFILLIPSLIIGWTSYQTAKGQVEEGLARSANQNVLVLNDLISKYIQAKIQDIDLLAKTLPASTIQVVTGSNIGESAEVAKMLDQYKNIHPELELAYIGGENGVYINSPANIKNPADYDPRQRPWYQNAMKNKGKAIVTAPYPSKATGNMVITIAKVTEDGLGVAAINVNLKEIQTIGSQVKIGNKGYVYILDDTRKYVVHPTAELGTEAPKNKQNDTLFSSENGTTDYVASDGTPKKLVFVTNKETGWKVAGTLSKAEAAEDSTAIFYKTAIVVILALLVGGCLTYFIVASISKPLKRLMEAFQVISEGDLTQKVQIKSRDEFGKLSESYNAMVDSLRGIVGEVGEKATLLAASSEELQASANQSSEASEWIAQNIQEVAAGGDRQVQAVESGSQVIATMAQHMNEVSANAEQSAGASVAAVKKAKEGTAIIQTSVRKMDTIQETVSHLQQVITRLGKQSNEIGQIIEAITQISGQTNLLALNAAIEAARAGEHGRGFAVVADEVRKLAEQSAKSAHQITALIANIQHDTDQAVDSMNHATGEVKEGLAVVHQAGEMFGEISSSIDQVQRMSEVTYHLLSELSSGTEQMTGAMDSINQVANESAAGTQNVSASAQEQLASMEEINASAATLSKMAEELQELIGTFKI